MNCGSPLDPNAGVAYHAVDRPGGAQLTDPLTDKGTACPPAERERLGLEGLVPPAVSTMTQQLERVYENFKAQATDLERDTPLATVARALSRPEYRPLRYEPSLQRDVAHAAAVCER